MQVCGGDGTVWRWWAGGTSTSLLVEEIWRWLHCMRLPTTVLQLNATLGLSCFG